jgi:hypothetical protein
MHGEAELKEPYACARDLGAPEYRTEMRADIGVF